jgi:hypothetical protein
MYLSLLEQSDFFVSPPSTEGGKPTLRNKILGEPSMILFTSNACEHCPKVTGIFNRELKGVNGCRIGVVHVDHNKALVQVSQKTTTPISYTPLILFYHKGVPIQEYSGEHTVENLVKFVQDAVARFRSDGPSEAQISKFSIGKAKSKDVCYLPYTKAYN